MKLNQLRKLIREELANGDSDLTTLTRYTWVSSELEEMAGNLYNILNNIDYIKSPRKDYILEALLELQGIIEKEGLRKG